MFSSKQIKEKIKNETHTGLNHSFDIVKTSAKCQIVIPSKLRKELGIEPGGKVLIEKFDDSHAIISAVPDDPIKSLRGIIQGGNSMAQELLEERREDNLRV